MSKLIGLICRQNNTNSFKSQLLRIETEVSNPRMIVVSQNKKEKEKKKQKKRRYILHKTPHSQTISPVRSCKHVSIKKIKTVTPRKFNKNIKSCWWEWRKCFEWILMFKTLDKKKKRETAFSIFRKYFNAKKIFTRNNTTKNTELKRRSQTKDNS